ncbi:A/G-specific adenine glycosylase [Oscillatoria amoena NRMC-F 0135]|nr:A/G-specific adenine glycosylase [Oscillatoria amoena NRMC-F 0135]
MKKLIIRRMDSRYFSQKVVEWYLKNKRNLPWRTTTDPYKVWLSEIILQQTRVQQGLPYYNQFVKNFPTVKALALASEQTVLRTWQGLGYYTRARNLHQCARIIVKQFNGKFPQRYVDLLELPGIGSYTAAAIASICFNEPRAVLDGNVYRVLARVFGIHQPVNSSAGKQTFAELADALIDKTNPALFNQAMMEFGALFCPPKKPLCSQCLFKKQCVAYAGDLQFELPVKLKKKATRKRYFNYVVFRSGKSLFMKKRTDKDIWNGLYDFYLLESSRPVTIQTHLNKADIDLAKLLKRNGKVLRNHRYKHVLSHQVVWARFGVIDTVPDKKYGVRKFNIKTVEKLPKPILISRFLKDLQLL